MAKQVVIPTLADLSDVELPGNHRGLVDLMTDFGVPVDRYGKKGAKSTESIWDKVQKKETRFGEFEGTLYRVLPAVARALITSEMDGIKYVLFENDQGIYADGGTGSFERSLFSDYGLDALVQRKSRWAVWETMTDGEDKDEAIVRGLVEELVPTDPSLPPDRQKGSIDPRELEIFKRFGIHSREDLAERLGQHVQHQSSEEQFEPSLEYPGLDTLYTCHTYSFQMQPFLQRMGYATRDEEGKLNFFGWVPADVARDLADIAEKQQRG